MAEEEKKELNAHERIDTIVKDRVVLKPKKIIDMEKDIETLAKVKCRECDKEYLNPIDALDCLNSHLEDNQSLSRHRGFKKK